MPNDGGYLCSYTTEEMKDVINKYPQAKKFFRRFLGAQEFINNKMRWCLWITQDIVREIIKIPPILEAVNKVKKIRSESSREGTRKLADTPMFFGEIRQPEGNYIIIPRHSSENRKYIPIGFIKDDIAGDSLTIIPNASMYHFGIINSNVHMEWVRVIAGRIKSDYRYSNNIVYNNFPWPTLTDKQKAKIEQTAQAILDARAKYPDCSLADMYGDNMYLFPELLKAHQANDKAVMEAYGFIKTVDGKATWYSPSECVATLMKMYQELVQDIT